MMAKKITNFAGQLKTMIRGAEIRITAKFQMDNSNSKMSASTVFFLMGTVIMSDKIKAWALNIYPHLIKMVDYHYLTGGIASVAQC